MRRTKEDSEKTREAILAAAAKIFSQRGVAAATLSEVAKEAGVTRGAVYWHFKNKADIFDVLHERIYTPLLDLLIQEKEEKHSDPLKRLEEICIFLLERIEKSSQVKESMTLFWLKCDYSGEWSLFRERHTGQKVQGRELYMRFFTEAQEMGLLPSGTNPEILTLSIGCFTKGIITEHLRDPEMFALSKEGVLMMKNFFRGLRASAALSKS